MLAVLPLLGRYLFVDGWRLELSVAFAPCKALVEKGSTKEDRDENGEAIRGPFVTRIHFIDRIMSCCSIFAMAQHRSQIFAVDTGAAFVAL
jgi:hypothetical protein